MLLLTLLACKGDPLDTATPVAELVPENPLIPGPGDPDHDDALAAKLRGYDRQFLAINAAPFGMSLDAYPSRRDEIDDWITQHDGFTREEFEAAEGVDLYELVYHYDEMGDLGMFGGVAALGDIYRYALLRHDAGAIDDDPAAARARFVRILHMLHAMQAVTGRPGSLVRGLGLIGQPGLEDQETTPLFDDNGDPLPAVKSACWRADQSGEFPELIWYDDTSKDQWIGYILALGAAYEVAKDDPDIDPALVRTLQADALAMGRALQIPHEETGLDLTLVDGDGRRTTFHDLNAQELEGAVGDDPFNPFNAAMALSGVKVLAVVSGDAEIDAFYHEIAEDRDYVTLMENLGAAVHFNYLTNYSGVNMAWVALYNLLRFEADPELRAHYERCLVGLWSEGTPRAASNFNSAWFNLIYAAYADADPAVLEAALENLRGFPDAPYWNERVENCDEAEIATGACVAIDGSTPIELYGSFDADGNFVPGSSRNEDLVATSAIPRSLRSPSNFEWRSDPYRVNGGGGDRLNPGGDLRAAYWSGRVWASGGALSPRAQ